MKIRLLPLALVVGLAAAGKVLGTTTESFWGAGTASLQVELRAAKATAGTQLTPR